MANISPPEYPNQRFGWSVDSSGNLVCYSRDGTVAFRVAPDGTVTGTGAGGAIAVTDGETTVSPASELDFSGATVTDEGSGVAGISVGGSVPVTVFLESNSPPAGGNIGWDSLYDIDGNPIEALPDSLGLVFNATGAGDEVLDTTAAGVWLLAFEGTQIADDTAHNRFKMTVADYVEGLHDDTAAVTSTSDAQFSTEPWLCHPYAVSGPTSNAIFVTVQSFDATAPDYMPLSYATLKIIRIA